jgi:hypothetical protein
MSSDQHLFSAQFPRSSTYHPEWVLANASGGANALRNPAPPFALSA